MYFFLFLFLFFFERSEWTDWAEQYGREIEHFHKFYDNWHFQAWSQIYEADILISVPWAHNFTISRANFKCQFYADRLSIYNNGHRFSTSFFLSITIIIVSVFIVIFHINSSGYNENKRWGRRHLHSIWEHFFPSCTSEMSVFWSIDCNQQGNIVCHV